MIAILFIRMHFMLQTVPSGMNGNRL